jgi:hypothetical protein
MVVFPTMLIPLKSYVDAHNAFIAAEQGREFFPDDILHGGREFDVHAGHDDLGCDVV